MVDLDRTAIRIEFSDRDARTLMRSDVVDDVLEEVRGALESIGAAVGSDVPSADGVYVVELRASMAVEMAR